MSSSAEASPFAFLAGSLCLDFANTAFREDGVPVWDTLDGYDDLLAWARVAGVLAPADAERLGAAARERPGDALAAFERAVAFRERVYRTFAALAGGSGVDPQELAGLNRALDDASAHRRLAADGRRFRWEWAGGEAELDRVLWPVAWSAGELLVGPELERVRRCAGEDCTRLFLDTSRGARRRWCDMSHCGNLAKVRRFRMRQGSRARPPGR